MHLNRRMVGYKLSNRLRSAGLMFTPVAVFLLLLFSEPIALFGWSDQPRPRTTPVKEEPARKQFDYINVAIDTALAYEPSLIRAGLIYDFTENKLVWEKNLDVQVPIASLTKMMVALITMEQVKAGKINLTDIATISKYATWVGGSRVYLKIGQKLSIGDLLQACMIRSGNDAAYALAEHIGGTEVDFVRLMNEKAESLGMESTCFTNSTGMPVKSTEFYDNESTAADLLLLARDLVKYESILEMTSRATEKIQNANGLYTYENRNTLVKNFDEIDGLKTGFTNAAKYCLVATSKRCDHRVITILLGIESKTLRYNIAVNLFNNYYSSIGLGNLGEKFEETASLDQVKPY